MQFEKHYTRAEANALLPLIRRWLERLLQLREEINTGDRQIASLLQKGHDLGGRPVNQLVRHLADFQETLGEFYRREIQLKDLDRGLIDFPAILQGREVFLCWEKAEEEVEFWHELDTGYAGREPL